MKWQDIESLDDLPQWLAGKTPVDKIALVEKNLRNFYVMFEKIGVDEDEVKINLVIAANEETHPMDISGEPAGHLYAVTLEAQGSKLGIAFIINVTEDLILGFGMIDDRTTETPITKN